MSFSAVVNQLRGTFLNVCSVCGFAFFVVQF